MQKIIKHLLTDKSIFIALVLSIFILIVSLIPINSKLLDEVKYSDKVVHVLFYLTLCLSWLFYFRAKQKIKQKFIIAFGIFVYGIIIEVLQSDFTTYRTGSLFDVLANTVGIAIGLLVFEKLYKFLIKYTHTQKNDI